MAFDPIATIIGGRNRVSARPAANTSRRIMSSGAGAVVGAAGVPSAGIAEGTGTENYPAAAPPYVSIFGPFDGVDAPLSSGHEPRAHAPGYPHRFSRADCSLCRRAMEVYTDAGGPYQTAAPTSSSGTGPAPTRLATSPAAAASGGTSRDDVPPSSTTLPRGAPCLQIASLARARMMYLELEAGRLQLSYARVWNCHDLYTRELLIADRADAERRARMIFLRDTAEVDMARLEAGLREVGVEHYNEMQRAERAENVLMLRSALDGGALDDIAAFYQ